MWIAIFIACMLVVLVWCLCIIASRTDEEIGKMMEKDED